MQRTAALSSTEAEYMALADACKQAIWARCLLKELQNPQDHQDDDPAPTVIWEDNQGAMALAVDPVQHARTKHIDVRYHFTREQVQNKSVTLKYCPTKQMVADALTKALAQPDFESLRAGMHLEAAEPLSE